MLILDEIAFIIFLSLLIYLDQSQDFISCLPFFFFFLLLSFTSSQGLLILSSASSNSYILKQLTLLGPDEEQVGIEKGLAYSSSKEPRERLMLERERELSPLLSSPVVAHWFCLQIIDDCEIPYLGLYTNNELISIYDHPIRNSSSHKGSYLSFTKKKLREIDLRGDVNTSAYGRERGEGYLEAGGGRSARTQRSWWP